ncbi:MAG: thioredoxin [Elusimicrobia bacterium]|nr:thioredoxin [Elusimicrobiota bacterium]
MPTEIADKDFDAEVRQSTLPVVIDFWAPWCGPCRALAPILEDISKEYDGKIRFLKVNTDENPIEASKLRISAIPTVVFYKDGKPVDQMVGVYPKPDIKKKLDSLL